MSAFDKWWDNRDLVHFGSEPVSYRLAFEAGQRAGMERAVELAETQSASMGKRGAVKALRAELESMRGGK